MLNGKLDTRTVAETVGCGLIVGVVPYLGAFVSLGLGIAGMTMGRKKRREAQRLLGEAMVSSIFGAKVGDEVRLHGRVQSGGIVRAPLTGNEGVMVDARVQSRRVGGFYNEVWHDGGAARFEVQTEEGTIDVDASRARLHAWRLSKRSWSGTPPPDIAEAMGGDAERLKTTYYEDHHTHDLELEYAEGWLVVGDQATLQGRVRAHREEKTAGAGYRDQAVRLTVQLEATDVSSLSDDRLRKKIREGNTEFAVGVSFTVIAVLNGLLSAFLLLN